MFNNAFFKFIWQIGRCCLWAVFVYVLIDRFATVDMW